MGMLQASLKRVRHSSQAAGLRKVGGASGSVAKLDLSHVSFPISTAPWWWRVCSSTLLSLPTFEDSAWHAGQNPLGLWVSIYAPPRKVPGLIQDVLSSAPSCPPYRSCRQHEPHSSCLSHCSRPQAAFPSAWHWDQPLSIRLLVCLFIFFKNTTNLFLLPIWNGYLLSKENFPYFSFSLSFSRSSVSHPYWVPLIIALFVYFFLPSFPWLLQHHFDRSQLSF